MLTEIEETFDSWFLFGEAAVKTKLCSSVILFVLGDIDQTEAEIIYDALVAFVC